ncbi:GNAT family N-acetyltransferase [Haloferula sp. A504]|uniref:bifunctional acetate--CoA ligase family protein/GNAT family N-acetyltransferase n=1 Tax=Haloferula sp. A504 TaxID=3373601 RepID=UPI0031BC3097|nr:GNAT family N-acetyltransferase [Verrucomicrobiaceae bacterium E54]
MSIRNLDKILNPKRVAVIGASNKPGGVGHTVLRNLISGGFSGVVYPVNPRSESVQGVQAYPDVASLPNQADLAVICTPAPTVPGLVEQCGKAGIRGIAILSAGFRETGKEGMKLEQQIIKTAGKYDGMRIVGPNSLGVIVPRIGLNASFAASMPRPGRLAFISQSGALCTSVLDWAEQQNVGFSYFVSIGNMLDVSFAHLIDYAAETGNTKAVMLYIESIPEARLFTSAARAYARTMPLVAYKAGRFAESAAAASSHTGALAGEDDVYDAAFQRAGVERVYDVDDLFDCAGLLSQNRLPGGGRLAIVTNAGGPGVMATDALISLGGTLAELSKKTIRQLNECLPAAWSHGNPVDVLGDAPPDRYAEAAGIVLADEGVDAVLAILTPQAMTDPTGTAVAMVELAKKSNKLILAAWMGGVSMAEGLRLMNRDGLVAYPSPDNAVRAFMHLVSYANNLRILQETPMEVPLDFELDRKQRIASSREIIKAAPPVLASSEAKELLEVYGIPTARAVEAGTAAAAVKAAKKCGYPVVLKVLSPQITHKTDVGGVELNVHDEAQVRAAFRRIKRDARKHCPDAEILGVTVEPMISLNNGHELIVGVKQDPTFGSVIVVGTGGTAAEVIRDRVLGLPPINERLARRMLRSLRTWPLLEGYRGRPGVDVDKLVEILIRFSYLVADHPEIGEFDINPLLALPDGAVALDARAMVKKVRRAREGSYPHLAIRPYPEQYVSAAKTSDGRELTIRPIKPEDELMWLDMLRRCSDESIHMRFFSLISDFTHEMAVRYCVCDYDRELALVAEAEHEGERLLVGIGRLVADPVHHTAEFAVIVPDAWQERGIGRTLTDACLRVAKDWGVSEVTATTLRENTRMIGIFRHRGFKIGHDPEDETVIASKKL